MITWECDYPHSDCAWPYSPEVLWDCIQGVPDDEINKITHLNAMREYSYDPFKTIPREQCTVSALRELGKNVDVTPRSQGGNRPIEEGDTRIVTSGDIMKLFVAAGRSKKPEPA